MLLAFSAQQAAVKALKGLLYLKGYRALVMCFALDLINVVSKFAEEFRKFIDFDG